RGEMGTALERAEKTFVVAGVKADARFIENVENAAKTRTDLRREANSLGFSPGKSGGRAVQAQITEADGQQKLDALGNLFERAGGDLFLARCERRDDFVHGEPRGAERKRSEIRNGPAGQLHGEGFGPQALAVADATLGSGHVLRHPLSIGIGIRFLEILFEKLKNTVEAKAFFFFAFGFWNIPILRIWSAGRRISVENQVLDFLGEFIERCAEIESVCVGSELERALKNCGRGT